MSARSDLVEKVAAAVGDTAHVIPYQDSVDVLDRITIMFKQLSLQPLPEAPRSAYRFNYVLTIVSPATDPQVSEAELDDFVPSLLGDLDTLDWFAWETADKVLGPGGMGLAYDVSCFTIAEVSATTAPPPRTSTRNRKAQ